MSQRVSPLWAVVVTAVPMFMVSLDNLVVTNALTDISETFDVGQADLQWVVNGYVLAFAGLLLAASALGDRFGRRRVFAWGVALFTVASVACALADSAALLVAARIVQGAGAAAILPLSLTLSAAAVPEERRSMAIGIWGGVNGLGIAVGPLVGGAVTQGIDWHWIFWLNLPIGVLALPALLWAVKESRGQDSKVDVVGAVLVSASVVAAVWAIVQAAEGGWGQTSVLGSLAFTVVTMIAFVVWEQRTDSPLVPLRFFRNSAFALSNLISLTMYFGVFGSIYYLVQFIQGPMGYTPVEAGLATLPWTFAPMVVVPLASAFVDRIGGGRLMAAGSLLQGAALGWIAFVAEPGMSYGPLAPAMVAAGIGMGLVFASNPVVVLASVAEHEQGKASGINNTVREFSGALGVAVLTTVFLFAAGDGVGTGGESAQAFVDGMRPAIWTGVAVVLVGAVGALFIKHPQREAPATDPAPAQAPAGAEPVAASAAN
ncbi:DHA2 family efflux MFS transporter permease subunit [Streptomyces sp. ISL-98]|uniref:DHA2 family efflux MFS transporter permease subunit n=1 Tax=Streptomyces sp. ISL-98 TaxID=2819192 RepID=UPI001BEC3F37|nr:DHA2 family efflux MFS transporter permease subunit [Streptomyces sp. ISL-98]MBT2510065.1 DHA2 family efflux MFS transporter permease subunit [Streptomyces sp. ISL-98]